MKRVIGPDFGNVEECENAMSATTGLAKVIDKCVELGDWESLFDTPSKLFAYSRVFCCLTGG